MAGLEHLPNALFNCGRRPGSAEAFALRAGARQPRTDTVLDHSPLELGEDTEHLEHGTTGRGRRVDPLLVQIEIDTFGVQLAEKPNQILKRPAEPVDGP